MSISTELSTQQRCVSLDVFRGLTMAGMILVNNVGGQAYAPLKHADWNGWTPTDLVFPSFLFIVGTSIAFSFAKRLERGDPRGLLFTHVVRRTMVILGLGMIYSGFGYARLFEPSANQWQLLISYTLLVIGLGIVWPEERSISRAGWGRSSPRVILALLIVAGAVAAFWRYRGLFADSDQRIPGVLQRIAICYLIASAIVLYSNVRGRVLWTILCLVGYWAIMRFIDAPAGYSAPVKAPEGLLHDWIDQKIFGSHIYSAERPDPEGLLSTLPAIATTLIGVLAGNWLLTRHDAYRKVAGLLVAGITAIAAGLVLDRWIPINKKLWTDSYVLFAGGVALYILGTCYLLVDVEGWRGWTGPFLVLGTNAIAVYLASGMVANYLGAEWPTSDGGTIRPRTWVFDHLRIADPQLRSLSYGLSYMAFWMLAFWPLYRKRWFIKV